MKLHRSGRRPEWAGKKYEDYNRWQTVAALTRGIVTPGNVLSVVGFAIALQGLLAVTTQAYWWATAGLFVGRLFDLADGWAAEATGTKSPLGELLDASLDKVITILTVLLLFATRLAPLWAVILLVLPHILIAVTALVSLARGARLHPALTGKISMALAWLALGGFVFTAAFSGTAHAALLSVDYALVIISSVFGLFTASRYITKPNA